LEKVKIAETTAKKDSQFLLKGRHKIEIIKKVGIKKLFL
jgi:hypothetical protein